MVAAVDSKGQQLCLGFPAMVGNTAGSGESLVATMRMAVVRRGRDKGRTTPLGDMSLGDMYA